MRNRIFISHAAPEDNEFAKWLSLQLIGLGYDVWCDVIRLKGGEDFWAEIEKEIREQTVKFLYVLSRNSNNRDGTLKELTVAQKVKKTLEVNAQHFIIPLHIDSSLSYDDINIDLVRLNSINFKESWHKGLVSLVDKLKEDNIPVSESNYDEVSRIWQSSLLKNTHTIQREEVYSSNWFPLLEVPETINFHKFSSLLPTGFAMWKCKYPARRYKDYFGTFANCYDFMKEIPKSEFYNPKDTISVTLSEILDGSYDTSFISTKDARNIVTHLLNISFKHFFKGTGCRSYKLASKRIAFWFPTGALEKEKSNGVLMVGKMKYGKDKRINWHFAVSGSAKVENEIFYVLKSHIVFTEDGARIISQDSIQHKGRRKQGKNWWNKHWREKLLGFLCPFANEMNEIVIPVGEEVFVKFSSIPQLFQSPFTYVEPSEDYLPDDVDFDAEDDSDETIEIDNDDE